MSDLIGIGSSQAVEWTIRDNDGEIVTDATVTAVLKTTDGITLDTFSLDLVDEDTGLYRGYISDDVTEDLAPCAEYVLLLAAVSGGLTEFRRITLIAAYRGEI